MGTQSTTTQNASYNPQALSLYSGLQGPAGNVLSQYLTNPYSSGLFNLQLQNAVGQANQLGQQSINNMAQNTAAGGFGGGNLSAYNQAATSAAGRARSGLVAGAYQNALLGAQQLQMGAANAALNYRPLQTGQTNVTSQTGLGTWLPQVAAAGLSLASNAATGGFSGGMGNNALYQTAAAGFNPGAMNTMSNLTAQGFGPGGYAGTNAANPFSSYNGFVANPLGL